MPEPPDYKTEIAILTEMVLDLYVKNAALASQTFTVASNPDDLREAEKKVWAKIGLLFEIDKLIQDKNATTINGGAIIDHEAPRERRFVAVEK